MNLSPGKSWAFFYALKVNGMVQAALFVYFEVFWTSGRLL